MLSGYMTHFRGQIRGPHWGPTMDNLLIDFWRKHECLYNSSASSYYDKDLKTRLWSAFASSIGKSGNQSTDSVFIYLTCKKKKKQHARSSSVFIENDLLIWSMQDTRRHVTFNISRPIIQNIISTIIGIFSIICVNSLCQH